MTRHTGRSRGFGFVEMLREYGQRAISELDGQQIDCVVLRVNEAKEI
jgi:RNA recognition motif-containing protein